MLAVRRYHSAGSEKHTTMQQPPTLVAATARGKRKRTRVEAVARAVRQRVGGLPEEWSASDVAGWLLDTSQQLGVETHFRTQALILTDQWDGEALQGISDDNLQALGVQAAGGRAKLIRAVKALYDDTDGEVLSQRDEQQDALKAAHADSVARAAARRARFILPLSESQDSKVQDDNNSRFSDRMMDGLIRFTDWMDGLITHSSKQHQAHVAHESSGGANQIRVVPLPERVEGQQKGMMHSLLSSLSSLCHGVVCFLLCCIVWNREMFAAHKRAVEERIKNCFSEEWLDRAALVKLLWGEERTCINTIMIY